MSAYKKLLTFFAFTAAVLAASATTSAAQGRDYRPHAARYYDPFFYADPWYGYQYPWRPYPPPYRYHGYAGGSVRLDVMPREAEVYIDGYYAGIVDDFDGAFQRLHVEPGEHEIEIYLDGHRPFRQRFYLTPDRTFRIRHRLQPLAAGEQPEPRPQPASPPTMQGGQGQGPPTSSYPRQPMPRRPDGRRTPPPPPPPPHEPGDQPPRGGQARSDYGTLSIRVQPLDAEVSIDGDPWRGPAGQDRLVIDVAEGSHTVEIRKAGFRTYVTQVEIRRGETSQLNVSLRNE